MKRRVFRILVLAAASLMIAPPIFNASAQYKSRDRGEFTERDEINQTFQLAPGARVEVISINGPLEIETTNGNTAEVHVVRSARNRADLDYRKIIIEHTPTSLRVYSEEPPNRMSNNINIHHRAVLKVPRPGELTVRNINGNARIGDVDGPVNLGNINGELEVGHAAQFADFSNINGNTTLTIAQLGERGIRMRNVNGNINLRFLDDLNADLEVRSFNGTVDSRIPNVSIQKVGRTDFQAQFGSGGLPITMSHINGVITIRGATDSSR